jgi:multiple sugar transport system permease protein
MAKRFRKLMVYTALLVGATAFILPLLWMLSTAVKPIDQAMSSPPRWLPYEWVLAGDGEKITVGLDKLPEDAAVPVPVQVAFQWLIEVDGQSVPAKPLDEVEPGRMVRVEVGYHYQARIGDGWRPAQVPDPDAAGGAIDVVYMDGEGYTLPASVKPDALRRTYDQTQEDLVGSFAQTDTLTIPSEVLIKREVGWDDRTELAHVQVERREADRAALTRHISIRWGNFAKAIDAMKLFPSYLKNTLILCLLTVIGTVCSSTLVAYGFARIEWPGRDKVFLIVMATMMVPFPVVMVPLFTMFKSMGFIGTLKPLWVPTFFAGAFNVFLLRQFFRTIPKDLSESARIDGCSELRIFLQIILPLAKPAIAVVALFQFMGTWNDFLGPLIYLTEQKDFTLALGLQAYQSQSGGTQWHYLMAASSMIVLPVIVLFFLAQRTFIEGISMTGLKG